MEIVGGRFTALSLALWLCVTLVSNAPASAPFSVEFSGENLSVQAEDTDLARLLTVIGDTAGVQVLVDRRIRKTVSVTVEAIPLQQAIQHVLRAVGEENFALELAEPDTQNGPGEMFRVFVLSRSQEEIADPTYRAAVDQARARRRAEDRDIAFFGEVLDDRGDPVVDATVQLTLGHYDPLQEPGLWIGHRMFEVTTDASGRFSVRGERGRTLAVHDIIKRGFAFERGINPQIVFHYWNPLGPIFVADPDNPVVFRMRMREPEELVLKGHVYDSLELNAPPTKVDLILRRLWPRSAMSDRWHEDLTVRAVEGTKGALALELTAPGDGNGIVEVAEVRHRSPEDGYQPSISVRLADWTETRHFHIRGRGGRIYARAAARLDPDKERRTVGVGLELWVNPAGSRTVDYSAEAYREWMAGEGRKRTAPGW